MASRIDAAANAAIDVTLERYVSRHFVCLRGAGEIKLGTFSAKKSNARKFVFRQPCQLRVVYALFAQQSAEDEDQLRVPVVVLSDDLALRVLQVFLEWSTSLPAWRPQ